ncbi:MAG: Transcriptional adapter ada2 [Watsoniomyces obsoletus]|nr:MAG: Transcriptional adapter ada2 [Watsoniomyces obsoletus]
MGVIRKKTARPGTEGGVKCVCDVCSVDITSTVHIRCAHEACNDYDLCVPCFTDGASSHNHDPPTHPYLVIEQHSVPIFTEDWGADEEMLLLEGAGLYGLGSWADIADHIGGFRTKDEVRDHYIKTYIESSKFPLPERASPHDTSLQEVISREEFQSRKKRRIEERKEAAKSVQPATPKTKPTASVPSCHEIQGYMPGRREFEVEYANDAEDAVQHMQFDPGDGINPRTGELEPDMELKLTVMDIYNSRLTARVERKKIMFEHHLLEYKKNTGLEKKRTKEERDLINKCKPYARMMNHADYEEWTQGLLQEHSLRQAIAQLQEWRQMGLAELKSGEKYESEKQQRVQRAQTSNNPLDRLQTSRGNKATPPVEAASTTAMLTSPELVYRPMRGGVNGGGSIGGLFASQQVKEENGGGGGGGGEHVNGTSTPSQQQTMQMPPLPNIQPLLFRDELPADWHLLTRDEQQLCSTIRVQPKPYLVIKEQVLKEAMKTGGAMKKKAVKEICRLDPNKASRVFEFFVNSGWISKG